MKQKDGSPGNLAAVGVGAPRDPRQPAEWRVNMFAARRRVLLIVMGERLCLVRNDSGVSLESHDA